MFLPCAKKTEVPKDYPQYTGILNHLTDYRVCDFVCFGQLRNEPANTRRVHLIPLILTLKRFRLI